jgi:hypothetical protein
MNKPSLSTAAAACLLALAACGGAPAAPAPGVPARPPARPPWDGRKAKPALQTEARYFPDDAPWYRDVSAAPVSAESDGITAWMVQKRPPFGFGGPGSKMRVDFSIVTVDVPPGTRKFGHRPVRGYSYEPDCDRAKVPVPPGGAVEQSYGFPTVIDAPFSGYACTDFDKGGDCHMIFLARGERRLYEIYHATADVRTGFRAGCLAVWDLSRTSPHGRGEQCSSADAAGFPIAPLLFTPEEVKAGHIDHAIRFILPNNMIRRRRYVAPATHGSDTSGPDLAGPYGFRMRLRADYPLATLTPAAQVVARAMQRYGMLLADGGEIALTAQSDVLSDVKWADLGFDTHSLSMLEATDFQVIDFGPPAEVTFQCRREPIDD